MIGLIDTGVSNMKSIGFALDRIKADYLIVKEYKDLEQCDRFIIPGVGSFSKLAIQVQNELFQKIKVTKKPVLGICLGMQFLLEQSDEDSNGEKTGLGVIPGKIQRLPIEKLPHMGWNAVNFEEGDPLFQGITSGEDFYFVHSFASLNNSYEIAKTTVDSQSFQSVLRKDNFYGVQFHPEKSARNGRQLLKNFSELIC